MGDFFPLTYHKTRSLVLSTISFFIVYTILHAARLINSSSNSNLGHRNKFLFCFVRSMCKQINGYTNIMHDKRVVRGSNFAKKTFVSWILYFVFTKDFKFYLLSSYITCNTYCWNTFSVQNGTRILDMLNSCQPRWALACFRACPAVFSFLRVIIFGFLFLTTYFGFWNTTGLTLVHSFFFYFLPPIPRLPPPEILITHIGAVVNYGETHCSVYLSTLSSVFSDVTTSFQTIKPTKGLGYTVIRSFTYFLFNTRNRVLRFQISQLLTQISLILSVLN